MLEQLKVRRGIHICNNVLKILEIFTAQFGKRGSKLIQKCRKELNRVAKYHVLFLLDLKVLYHVLTKHVDFAVRSLSELVNY